MEDGYNEHGEELEEELEEKFESLEKDFDGMKRVVNEPLNRSQRQAFNREIGNPEGLEEERFVTSDEVEKTVIIDNEQDNNQEFIKSESFEETKEETEDDISFEKLNSDGSYEKVSDNELGSEYFENYDQPEMVREWEASSPSELEGILTPDAIEELKSSMEVIGGLHSIGEVLEESIPEELIDDLGEDSEADTGSDSGSGNII